MEVELRVHLIGDTPHIVIRINYGTAYAALVIMGGLREGDRVLIHAAAGGIGSVGCAVFLGQRGLV